jgi:hypothetical protein
MLAEVQARLHDHFKSLSQLRADLDYPVYALEHCLTPDELNRVRTSLKNDLRREAGLSDTYWLLWVIVATEIGYTYDGDEYWDTFVKEVPDWSRYGDRSKIRTWFAQFARRYRGFIPKGRWAEHFSIIAWPIAHAILPRDLQGQFARRLYERRFQLASNANSAIEQLGAILRTGDVSGSSRFQHFLEQPELGARLILALRDEDVQGTVPAINKQTLDRLISDLEVRRSARDWLREARKVLRDARIRELVGSPRDARELGPSETRSDVSCITRLIARQTSDGGWLIGIELPDLGHLLRQMDFPTKALDQTRVRLADRPDGWKPGSALLSLANTEQRLRSLTDFISGPALVLENEIRGLSAILAEALHIRGASPWILRIQDDGVARQVIGNHVRAGQSYLIISNADLATSDVESLRLRHIEAQLVGASVYALDVPLVLEPNDIRALDRIRIGYALRVNFEIAGLVPRWDRASGSMVCLTTEELMLRLWADHPVRDLTVSVDRRPAARIPVGPSNECIVSLGFIHAGSHLIEVGGTTSDGPTKELSPERFEVIVRAPVPWTQGIRDQAGFRAIVEPSDSNLESVLTGRARVTIIGPPERPVLIGARLFNLNGHTTEHIGLGSLAALTDQTGLNRLIGKLGKEPSLTEKVQTAPRVDLTFVVDELGLDTLTFSRRVHPLRWRLTTEGQDYRVRLIDEADTERPVAINVYHINQPDLKEDGAYALYRSGQIVRPPGALFTAIYDKKHYSAIVSIPAFQRLTNLQALGVAIAMSPSQDTPKHIPRLLALRRLWGRAPQILGPLSLLRKAEVCLAFEQRIAGILCGHNWVAKAGECQSADGPCLEQLRHGIGGSVGYGARLRGTNWSNGIDDPTVLAEFVRLAGVYQVSNDPGLCLFALRLAFAPTIIKFTSPEQGASECARLAEVPILARAAFFARTVSQLAGNSGREEQVVSL